MHDGAPSPLTLVIATGHALSLALLDGNVVLAQSHDELERGHAEALMPAIERLLQPFGGGRAAVSSIIVETGPGSFTGLRVGLAAGRALGVAWGVPVHGVRSTELVAAEARTTGIRGPILVALAAPRGQVWSEAFDADGRSLAPPVARQPAEIAKEVAAAQVIVGSAAGLMGIQTPIGQPRAGAYRWMVGEPVQPAELLYVRQEPAQAAA